MDVYSFVVWGVPVPQGRPRATLRNKKAFQTGAKAIVGMYDPADSRAWKTKVREAAAAYMEGKDLLEGPLRAEFNFFFPKPKSKPAWKKLVDVRPDVSNTGKLIEDSLNGTVYKDDSQICEILWGKYYENYLTEDGEFSSAPCVEIKLIPLEEIRYGSSRSRL